ncbi:MAG: hypothetical protein IKA71_03140 [Lentisphaeria bacterium]|nr:hypothetical protein [Lentisphaeria bacterium]
MKKRLLLWCFLGITVMLSAGSYQRKLPKTYIFSRGQWHYNPVLNYSGRWVDMPLLVDPELNTGLRGSTSQAGLKALELNVKRYGLDGLASLKGNGTPELIGMLEKNAVPGFILLPEIYATGVGMYKAGVPLDKMRQHTDLVFLPAARSSITLKHNGKTIISSYNADDRPAEFWKELLADYRKTEGDKFLFLPLIERPGKRAWHNWRAEWGAGKLTAGRREIIKEHFRQYTRACDGLYLACAPVRSNADRHTDIEFFKEMIKMAVEVLAEPEFKDKLFAIAARIGHENATRVGYIRGSYGSWCYRETMQTALEAGPDIIIIPEWDEQNENTSLRPTRANLSTFTRITRVFQNLSADLPGDDLNVPNLVISCRKVIALGEETEYELLGLPDAGGAVEAQIVLRAPDGKKLFTSPRYTFSGKEMTEHRFKVASEIFAPYPFIRPELTVVRNGKKTVYYDSLHYIKIEPVSNCDYQFVKQPLRDLLIPVKSRISWDGTRAEVDFDAGEPIAYAEILDDNMPVYAATADGKPYWTESETEKVFAITFQNIGNFRDQLCGTLTVPGIPGARWMRDTTSGWPSQMGDAVTGESFKLNFNQRVEINRFFLAIPADKAGNAVLKIDIPGYFEKALPLAQVLDVKSFGVPGKKVPVMTVSRQDFQILQVKKLRKNAVKFTARIQPHSRRSTLHFQVITESGKAFRSAPVTVERNSGGNGKLRVYSERSGKPVTLTVPESRIPRFEYNYSTAAGTAIHNREGLRYSALPGYTAHICGRLGARRDSTVFISTREYPKNARNAAPEWGDKGWEFTAPGQHITLPTGVISRRAAFKFSMEVLQKDPAGKQTLLDNRSSQPGVIKVIADNGKIKVEITDHNVRIRTFDTGLVLPEGKMAKLTVNYQLDKLTVSLNDKTFTTACSYPGLCDCVAAVGGGRDGFFRGTIRNFAVDYSAE